MKRLQYSLQKMYCFRSALSGTALSKSCYCYVKANIFPKKKRFTVSPSVAMNTVHFTGRTVNSFLSILQVFTNNSKHGFPLSQWLLAVPDSAQFASALSRTVVTLTWRLADSAAWAQSLFYVRCLLQHFLFIWLPFEKLFRCVLLIWFSAI